MESIILGTLLNGEGLEQVDLLPSDFSFPYSLIFQVIQDLADRGMPYDLPMVAEELERRGMLERVGGRKFLMSVLLQGTLPALLHNYVRAYREKLRVARVRSALMEAYEALGQGVALPDALAKVELALSEDPVEELDLVIPVGEAGRAYERFAKSDHGLENPIAPARKYVRVFREGEVLVVGGRPGMGKTALITTFLYDWSVCHGRPCLLVSLEMSPAMIYERLLAIATGQPTDVIRTLFRSGDLSSIASQKRQVDEAPIDIMSEVEVSPEKVKHILRRRRGVYQAVFIDYIQLMSGDRRANSRYEEVSHVSRAVKVAAMQGKVFVCCAAQLSRLADRVGDEPELDHLRDSSALESDADYVFLLSRDEARGEDGKEGKDVEAILADIPLRIKVAKNRHGPTGSVRVTFHADRSYIS